MNGTDVPGSARPVRSTKEKVMDSRVDMVDLIRSRTPGYALPQPFYTDAAVFRFDLENIWYRDWLFAIPACEIRRPAIS